MVQTSKAQRAASRARKLARKREQAATLIQAVWRGKRQRGLVLRKLDFGQIEVSLDEEIVSLQREIRLLEENFEEGGQNHAVMMEQLKQEREMEADVSYADILGDSLGALDINSQRDEQTSVFETEEVQQLRKANKKLRKDVQRLIEEEKALQQNVLTLKESNKEASEATIAAKNAQLKMIVKTNRLRSEADRFFEEMQTRAHQYKTRVAQYQLEKRARSTYLKTLKKMVKLVRTRIPESKLANDVDKVASKCVAAEMLRQKNLDNRQDSVVSLSSLTSITEHSDSETD